MDSRLSSRRPSRCRLLLILCDRRRFCECAIALTDLLKFDEVVIPAVVLLVVIETAVAGMLRRAAGALFG